MEELKKKATELGVEFTDETTKDDLNALITKREEELSSDLDYLKKQVEFYKTESKKAFEKRDVAMKDKKLLADKTKELEDKLKNAVDKEELEKLQKEFKDLKVYKEEIERLKEEEESKKLDEVQRSKLQFEKEMKKMQDQLDEMKTTLEREKEEAKTKEKVFQKQVETLRGSRLEADVLRSATKNNAWNPDQIVALVKGFFTYDEQLDKYTHLVRDDKGKIVDEQSVDEFIKVYLSKEENENLVKSTIKTDTTFSTNTQTTTNVGIKTTTKGKYKADDPQIIKEATDKNLPPADWAEIKERMENKQNSMREKKQK